jgi:beta-glucosidase
VRAERDRQACAAGDSRDLRFPEGFTWGVAVSAHQVEGGNTNNQWHAWEQAGHIAFGQRAERACDWWEHAEADFDRARELGVIGVRLSVEWSRIEPEEGRWDDAAVERYREMLQGLRERGIEPLVTLHHFTNPLWLERQGAFANPRVVSLFARFARRCVEALGDLCTFWCTVNEPNVYAAEGYVLGVWPPGRKGDALGMVRVYANMLRAHAAAYEAIHAAQPGARVGLAHNVRIFDPARPRSWPDRFAAGAQDLGFNALALDALARGRGAGPLRWLAGDLAAVRDTCDYVGVNYYSREMVAFDLRRPTELFGRRFTRPGAERMDGAVSGAVGDTFGEIYPDGLRRVLLRVAALGWPIYVTESGFADADDSRRPHALVHTLAALHAAIEQGADVRGYYHWSLIDNFEWTEGWHAHFGLIAMDPETQRRIPRASAEVYREICRANALPADLLDRFA